jgi:TetR/AcrR family transcriptional regulator of autoinduction and epiphytic fitness
VGETSVTAASTGDAQPSGTAAQQDGRLTRAARTRASVVDALLTLNDQGNLRPTARDIATEAGVSLRSLYVHFDDLEALFVAAGHRHAERLGQVLSPIVTDGGFDERLEAFLLRRARIHEFGAGVRRAAVLQEPFSPVIKQALGNGRQALRAEVATVFAPEAAAAEATVPDRLVRALDIAASPMTWESLRTHQGLSVEQATAQVRDMILAFVHAWVPADAGGQAPATPSPSAASPPG